MKIIIFLMAMMASALPANAQTVTWCTNCSDMFTQSLERVTNLEKLTQVFKQVDEAVTQTEKQITMVQQGIDRYTNILKNTATLPAQMRSKLQGTLGKVTSLTQLLNVQRGDATALSHIFRQVYASKGTISDLVRNQSNGNGDSASAETLRMLKERLGDGVDSSQEAAFQESGSQINEIEQKSAELDGQLNDLLQTPDGQMKALEAGNQIATMQLQESQRLRTLLAVSAQAAVQRDMKAEQEKKISDEAWKSAVSTNKLQEIISRGPSDDPF